MSYQKHTLQGIPDFSNCPLEAKVGQLFTAGFVGTLLVAKGLPVWKLRLSI